MNSPAEPSRPDVTAAQAAAREESGGKKSASGKNSASGLQSFQPAGSNAERTRLHNRRLVLGQVHAAGARGRAEIARGSGLSIQAVSNIIAELETDGMLIEAGTRSAGRGLPAKQYVVNPSGGFAIGAEVRPDALLLTLLDLSGTPRFTVRESLAEPTPETVATALARLGGKACRDISIAKAELLGAGVVMPGALVDTGLAGAASDLGSWQGVDVAELFGQALGVEVLLENDANAAALGERVTGVARQLNAYAFLYFGSGLGLGIVHEGRLLRGALGNAGEIGHVAVLHEGDRQPLESIASRLALTDRLQAVGVKALTSKAIDTLHRADHPVIMEWLAAATPALAQAVELVENLLDPELVIFGGAMPDKLLDALVERLPLSERSVASREDRSLPRVVRGASGRMTAAVGGASLVINRAFTPQIAASR